MNPKIEISKKIASMIHHIAAVIAIIREAYLIDCGTNGIKVEDFPEIKILIKFL